MGFWGDKPPSYMLLSTVSYRGHLALENALRHIRHQPLSEPSSEYLAAQ
jgi:hypothetical protein